MRCLPPPFPDLSARRDHGGAGAVTGGAVGWIWIGLGALLRAEIRANRAPRDIAAVTRPGARTALHRAVWPLAVLALLWPAVSGPSASAVVSSAGGGSARFGAMAVLSLGGLAVTAALAVALRRLWNGSPYGAGWGVAAGTLLALLA
ncbi:hypothetical protein AB0467_11360 [Streptomyces sp. NPDC052095]|uniref:hypothetical protein n=1 Tax=unclassified Streptomyces TaxID=2593676 RepID=UPI00344EE7CF